MEGNSRGSMLIGVIALFLALSWITVPLRVYVRARMIKSFALDDWLAIVTLFCFTLLCVTGFLSIHYGTGMHMPQLTVYQMMMAMKFWWYAEVFYVLATFFLRLAVGFFLLRIAIRKWHRQFLWLLIVLNTIFNCYYFAFAFLQCFPVNYFWTRVDGMHKGYCVAEMTVKSSYVQCGLMATLDYSFGLLPIFIIWDLKMNVRKKILVGIVLSLGIFASTGTIVRLFYVHTLAHTSDFLYVTLDIALWSFVEAGLGLVCISLAALRPLLRAVLIKFGVSSLEHSGPGVSPSPKPVKSKYRAPADEEMQLRGLGNTNRVEAPPPTAGNHAKMPQVSSVVSASDDDEIGITKTTELTTWLADEDQSRAERDLEAQQHRDHPSNNRCSACRWGRRIVSG